jgi:hypothetical protein
MGSFHVCSSRIACVTFSLIAPSSSEVIEDCGHLMSRSVDEAFPEETQVH